MADHNKIVQEVLNKPPDPIPDTIPCPNCDGAGGWMRPEYEVGGACVGQYFEDCARCLGSGQVPKPKPPKRDDFRCPEHGEPVTQHVALTEGGYRRVCPLCPPVDPLALSIAANEARDEREWERKVASSK